MNDKEIAEMLVTHAHRNPNGTLQPAPAPAGEDANLKAFATKDLVAELRTREGVEAVDVSLDEEYWVTVGENDSFRDGGMHDLNTGPAIILKVID